MAFENVLPYLMSSSETMKKRIKNPQILYDEFTRPSFIYDPRKGEPGELVPDPKSPQELATELAMNWGAFAPASSALRKVSNFIVVCMSS